jgi:hypothetical protein
MDENFHSNKCKCVHLCDMWINKSLLKKIIISKLIKIVLEALCQKSIDMFIKTLDDMKENLPSK